MTDFRDQFTEEYFAECDEHLTVLRRALLLLEASVGKPRPDRTVIEELFRSYHSLKGLAGMVEDRNSELLAHEMEGYLRAIRDGDLRLTTNGIEGLIDGTAMLEMTIAARRQSSSPPDATNTLAALRALAGHLPLAEPREAGEDAAATPNWECIFTPSSELAARGINVDLVRARLREAGEIVSATPLVTGEGVAFRFLVAGTIPADSIEPWQADGLTVTQLAVGPVPGVAGTDAAVAVNETRATSLSAGHYVRVDLARLDELMHMIGDLVIMRARLHDSLSRVEAHVPPSEWRLVQENSLGIERQLRTLREGVMRVRLVPVGEIFRRMPFVVRDLARETGQRIRVEVSGQDTEIDKFLVERMMDPVLHLVRNSVSHGLEPADERIAAGKPPEGTVSLSASAAGDLVTLEIADDGRGVDAAKVVERAARAGLPVPAQIDDAALFDLICTPGFSTRDESDRGSGRGVGMSVVRTTVHELGGSVRMHSTPGEGTRFVIELPLTLAITDALIAKVGSQTFAVPQTAVREVIEIDPSAIRPLEGTEVIVYRNGALPVVRLSVVLGIPTPPRARLHAFVIGTGSAAIGLVVDRVVGQREIVVRSTVDPLIRVPGIGGATDLGDGRAVLILDAAGLTRLARTAVRDIA